ncbi:hypothetical protein CR513_13656, partial [Mucuna pruriens]
MVRGSEEQRKVKEDMKQFFQNRFSETTRGRRILDGVYFKSIGEKLKQLNFGAFSLQFDFGCNLPLSIHQLNFIIDTCRVIT